MFKVSKAIQAAGRELQDRAEFRRLGSALVVMLADGAGGLSGGAEAAEYLVGRLGESVTSSTLNQEELSHLVERLDQEMADAGSYGETTCVVAAMTADGIVGASVGDSGAWLVSPSGVDELTAAQRRKPFVGSGRAIAVGFSRPDFAGTLLVASDGLLKHASRERIASEVQTADLDEAVRKLVALARLPSGALPDDISVLLARKS